MKRLSLASALLFTLLAGVQAAEAQQQVFGPSKYEVKERYGKDNVYQETFRAPEGPSLIRIQNGTQPSERPDLLELSVNGVKLLRDGSYGHPYLACFTTLRKENSLELNVKDQKPSGMKRPVLPPRFLIITALPASPRFVEGVFGVGAWDGLKDFIAGVQKMKSPDSFSLAVAAADLRNDAAARAEAVRKLADRKDPAARDFLARVFGDVWAAPDVKAEAAFGLGMLGDVRQVPSLLNGLLDPDEKIRVAAARALAFYPEQDTRGPLTKMLERLDSMRKTAVIRAITSAGWKPVGTLMDMAGTADPYAANVAIELLGNMKDPRAVDLLLKALESPGERSMAVIISALGETKDSRAADPLLAIAKDPVKRKGKEVELGTALANLGDPRAADIIREMAIKAETRSAHMTLRDAYKRLTGKEM